MVAQHLTTFSLPRFARAGLELGKARIASLIFAARRLIEIRKIKTLFGNVMTSDDRNGYSSVTAPHPA
jgi:hypothetical protein